MDIFKQKNAEVHMEQGPIGRTLLLFAIPILLSQILQQMYSIADCMIVGHFCGGNGLAAAGEAALILSVIINFFVGFSTGVSAVTAAAFGAFQYKKLSRILHSVIFMSLISGAVLTLTGITFSGQFLLWIHCPEEVFAPAQCYLKICMMGIIPQFIYNMGNAILRSLGNTREPLYFLTFSSVLNLVLDVLFVIGLGMGLPGAGIATVISQWVLALIMIWKMTCLDERYQFCMVGLLSGKEELGEIVSMGLPSGMQAVFMSISSLLIQYSINSFGADAAAGMVVFARVEGFLYYPAFSYGMALTGFIGQNYGAKKMDRVQKGMKKSILTLSIFTVAAGGILMAAAPVILKLFTAEPEILANGRQAILCIFPFYFLYAINQVYIGGLKGLGKTGFPMLCSLICYCIFRVVWCRILLLFFWDIRVIYFSYDVSWVIMIALLVFKYRNVYNKILEGRDADKEIWGSQWKHMTSGRVQRHS